MTESLATKETEITAESENKVITEDVIGDKTESGRVSESKDIRISSTTSKAVDDLLNNENDSDSGNINSDSRNIRRIIAEDPDYNLATVQELEQKSLNRIIENFAFNANMYKQLKPAHKRKVLDKISVEIPLKVVTDLIEDGIYWKRRCLNRWSICDVSHYGGSWKRLFFERNLENIIETFIPEKTDRTCLDDTVGLSAPYVERLIVTQLLPPIKSEPKVIIKSDESSEPEDEIEEAPKIDHLSFDPIVSKLLCLTDLRISYDVKNCGMNFEWNIFQFTINDCLQLAKCVAAAKQLKVFHLTRSRVDCDRCRVIISHLLDHPCLIELDFSHNHIGDRGARALGKILNNRSHLEVLKISNNMIKTAGAQAIAFAIKKNTTLKTLEMRLNRILDEGGQAICKSLLTNQTLTNINLAGNEMSEPTAAILAQVVNLNTSLVSIDLSNNRLGPDGGKQIQEGMTNNRKLLNLDLRFTDCGDEAIYTISQIIFFNQKLKMYENETDLEIKNASPFIIADLRQILLNDMTDNTVETETVSVKTPARDNLSRDLPPIRQIDSDETEKIQK